MRKIYPKQDRAYPEIVKPIHMKTFEIEVVRTYTTTVEVELPDNFTEEQITQCVTGNFEWNKHRELHEPYDMVWDEIANGELEQ